MYKLNETFQQNNIQLSFQVRLGSFSRLLEPVEIFFLIRESRIVNIAGRCPRLGRSSSPINVPYEGSVVMKLLSTITRNSGFTRPGFFMFNLLCIMCHCLQNLRTTALEVIE